MARQPYFVNTTQKILDVEFSFSGGMDQQSHPEKLKDNQAVLMENVDLVAGGVAQARGGYAQDVTPSSPIAGNTQGRFRYENLAGGQDIVAINGHLYTLNGNVYTLLNIDGLPSFQTVRPIGAVQYRNDMYFATGSGLVKYDGVKAELVEAYRPNGLEALYIGTNGYAPDPDNYLSDMTGSANVILGVVPDDRYGIVNEDTLFTVFIESNGAVLEYLWETKLVTDVDYTKAQDWSENKTWTANFAAKGDYMVRVSMRVKGQTTTNPDGTVNEPPIISQYILPRYKVNTTPDEHEEPEINFDDMKLCNRIFVHYDRLCMYGDTNNPENLYVSHLNNFTYWPRTNILPILDPLRGELRKVIRYRDFLVCFTDGSVQKIIGTMPSEFEVSPIHTTLGTKYPYSVQIIQNYIVFVGNDNGIYIIKTFNYSSEDKMNVQRIDLPIRDVVSDLLKASTNVQSCVYNNQYYLYIGSNQYNYIYRFYYDFDVWVRDKTSISFKTMDVIGNTISCTSPMGGTIYKLRSDVFKDGTNSTYNMRIISKDYDFGYPHHRKKLKQYQVLAKITNITTLTVSIYLDNTLLFTKDLVYDIFQNSDAQKLKLMSTGRFRYVKTELLIPVKEQVQLIGHGFVYKMNTPK